MAIAQILVGTLAAAALLTPVARSVFDVKAFAGIDDRCSRHLR